MITESQKQRLDQVLDSEFEFEEGDISPYRAKKAARFVAETALIHTNDIANVLVLALRDAIESDNILPKSVEEAIAQQMDVVGHPEAQAALTWYQQRSEALAASQRNLREQALAKLTEREKQALGLA